LIAPSTSSTIFGARAASFESCVAMISVGCFSARKRQSNSMISWAVWDSHLPVGPSARLRSGSVSSAQATEPRGRPPPDRSPRWILNHGVAETQEDMQPLLLAAGAANDEPLSLLVPTRQAGFFRWCLAQGLRMIKPMTLMAMREYHQPAGVWYPSVAY